MSTGKLRESARRMGLGQEDVRAFLRDPEAWLQDGDPPHYLLPWVDSALDEMWQEYHARASVHEKKRRAMRLIFGYTPQWTWEPHGRGWIGVGPELYREDTTIHRRGLVRPYRRAFEWVVVTVTYPGGRTRVRRWRGKERLSVSARAALQEADRQVGAMGGSPG